MSKRKTKQAHRELKRDKAKKAIANHRKAVKASTATTSASKPSTKKQKTNMGNPPPEAPPKALQASQRHSVPFGEYDHILLVGEGDFSFTRSLVLEHGCANVTATSYDSATSVREKYPTFESTHEELTSLTPPVPLHHDVDAAKLSSYKHLRCKRDDDDDEGENDEGWDTIAFMFPHTGGLSTDVNRQVRANQALLVSFFKSCLETSTPKARLQRLSAQRTKTTPLRPQPHFLRMGGKIMVALFEGEPYTLWNVRDLARHVGLRVVESYRFDWTQYPGYKHVRTLGAIEGGGAWQGEDREARMYIFEKVELVPDTDEEKELEKMGQGRNERKDKREAERTQKKRPREESASEDEG